MHGPPPARALKSDGGWISSGNADAWGMDEKSFIGVFRFLDVETAQKFFAEGQVIYTGLGWIADAEETRGWGGYVGY